MTFSQVFPIVAPLLTCIVALALLLWATVARAKRQAAQMQDMARAVNTNAQIAAEAIQRADKTAARVEYIQGPAASPDDAPSVLPEPKPRVMGQNHVQLFEIAGSDLGIALSAWTSTSRDLDPAKIARVPALLGRLLRDGHHTPFEKSYLRFLLLVDDATHVHILKHRIGVPVNGASDRYMERTADNFYIPDDWPADLRASYAAHARACFAAYHQAIARLEAAGVPRKRAKESARFHLPKGAQITLDVSFNWRSFIHFLRLRLSDHAQKEVREVAAEMLRLIEASGRYPVTCRLARAYLALHHTLDAALSGLDLLGVLPSRFSLHFDPKEDAAQDEDQALPGT